MSKQDEAQIRAVIEDWAAALRAKNAERVMSYGTADMMSFALSPPLVTVESTDGVQAWFNTWQGDIGYEFRDLQIVGGDGVGFSHSLNHMTGMRTSGDETDLWFRHTLGFRKFSDTWKIVHMHESVPFKMDGSYKAAIDLKP
jgi:PhnB protein